MTLTTGSTLQGGKYVIQALLNQSDFGITYQATHTLLDQPVALQTLNEVVRHRSDFTKLRQQFMAGVRSLSQRSDTPRVLDCFEEGDQPYVVLQFTPGQAPLSLNDWLKFSLDPEYLDPQTLQIQESPTQPAKAQQTVAQAMPIQQSPAQPSDMKSEAAPPSPRERQTPESQPAVTQPAVNQSIAAQPAPSQSAPSQSVPTQPAPSQPAVTQPMASQVTEQQAGSSTVIPTGQKSVPAPSSPRAEGSPMPQPQVKTTAATIPVAPKVREVELPQISPSHRVQTPVLEASPPKRKVPIALLVTALAGLGLGAGIGAALRYEPIARTNGALYSAPSLFRREQSFPADGDWPITEMPSVFSPEIKAEEPVYRAPTPDYYNSPSPQPLYPTAPGSDFNSDNLPPIPAQETLPEVKSDPVPADSALPKRSPLPFNQEPSEQTAAEEPPIAGESEPIPELNSPAPLPPVQEIDPSVLNSAPPQAPKALPMTEPSIVSQ